MGDVSFSHEYTATPKMFVESLNTPITPKKREPANAHDTTSYYTTMKESIVRDTNRTPNTALRKYNLEIDQRNLLKMSEETKHLKLPNETLFQFASMEIAALVPDPFKRFTLLKTIVFKLKQQAMRKTKPNPHSLELIVECMDKLVESASVIGESLSITMQNLQTRDDFKNTVQSQRDKFMRSLKDVVKWFRPLKSERIDKHLSISDQVDAVDTFRAACRDAIRNMNTKFNKKFTTFSERYAQEKKINMPDVTDNNDIEDVRLRVSNMYTQTYLPVPLSVWKNIKVGKSLQNAPLLPDQKAFQTIIDTVSRCESHVTYVKQRLETVSVQDGDVRPMLEYDDANKLEFNLGKQDVLRKVYPTLSDAELEDLPIRTFS